MTPATKALLLRLLATAAVNAEDDAARCRMTNVYGASAEDRVRLNEYSRSCEMVSRKIEDARREVEKL